jgi:DNA mismatch endonuclease, patch repair protein
VSAAAPRFRGYKPSSAEASRALRGNRKRESRSEILLAQACLDLGLRFARNVGSLLGSPDVVFEKERVAVFCDGDFWHGRHWPSRRTALAGGSNADYWIAKIEYNMARDVEVASVLTREGWLVLRLWEGEVKADPMSCAERVRDTVLGKV